MENHKFINEPESMIAEFEKHFNGSKRVICLFKGGPMPGNPAESWCDDCDAVKPNIEKAAGEVEANIGADAVIITAVLDAKEDWKGVAEHPYRHHPQLEVNGIPTMIMWKDQNELVRCNDTEHFQSEDLMAMFSAE